MPLHEFFKQARKVTQEHEPFGTPPQGAQEIDRESELYCRLALLRCCECDAPTPHVNADGEPLCDTCYNDCTCRLEPLRMDMVSPPEVKRNRTCPIHSGYDEDAERDRMNEKTGFQWEGK